MSRVLQQLRDYGFIEFISKGKYRLLRKDIEFALWKSKKMSKGEKLVARILDQFGILYKTETIHSDLKYKGFLRFDFEINRNGRKFVIEVDGIQHERPIDFFGGLDAFEIRKKCDQIKNEYCSKNNIMMIRIKHDQLNYNHIHDKIAKILNLTDRTSSSSTIMIT